MKIGVQMYSLRDHVKEVGIEKTLDLIAECGCDCVEPICDEYGIGYKATAGLMRKRALTSPSMHIAYPLLLDKDKLKELRDTFALETAVIPWMETEKFFDKKEREAVIGKALDNACSLGLVLAYHNHAGEFGTDGILETLPAEFPSLKLQPDIFWIKAAGKDPLDFVKKNMNNIGLLHIKEFGDSVDTPAPIVGEGATHAAEILRHIKSHGCPVAILEYEKPCCDDATYLKKSIKFMKETINV